MELLFNSMIEIYIALALFGVVAMITEFFMER